MASELAESTYIRLQLGGLRGQPSIEIHDIVRWIAFVPNAVCLPNCAFHRKSFRHQLVKGTFPVTKLKIRINTIFINTTNSAAKRYNVRKNKCVAHPKKLSDFKVSVLNDV